jgi:hypothetical protein
MIKLKLVPEALRTTPVYALCAVLCYKIESSAFCVFFQVSRKLSEELVAIEDAEPARSKSEQWAPGSHPDGATTTKTKKARVIRFNSNRSRQST